MKKKKKNQKKKEKNQKKKEKNQKKKKKNQKKKEKKKKKKKKKNQNQKEKNQKKKEKNTLVFTLIVQRVFSFSSTAFGFHFFHLNFCLDLVLSLHQGVFRPLFYVGYHQKSCFKKI
jgi:cation transport ATPase